MTTTAVSAVLKRTVLLCAFAGSSAVSCFGESTFYPVGSTPYDHQMARVHPTLSAGPVTWQTPVSLMMVSAWMSQLYAIPYRFSPSWRTPMEVSLEQAADCKGKAVALYSEMRGYGARNLRIVIGKRHIYDLRTHAWVEWNTGSGTYLLDPTFTAIPMRMAEVDPLTYVALYAFDGERKYRASNTTLLASSTSRVASGVSNRAYRSSLGAGAASTPNLSSPFAPSGFNPQASVTQPSPPAAANRLMFSPMFPPETQNFAPSYSGQDATSAAMSSTASGHLGGYQQPMYLQQHQPRSAVRATTGTQHHVAHVASTRSHHQHVRRVSQQQRSQSHQKQIGAIVVQG